MRSIADRWISPVELSARRVKAGQHDAPSRGHGCASRAIGCVGEVGKWGGCDSSPEAPGRGARGGGAQGASSRGLWRGEWGMHQGGGVLADRLRWCGYSRAHETQTAREVWLARGGQAALSSVMVWRRRRRSVQRFGSAEVWLSEKIGHPNRHGCDRNAKEADSFRWFRSYHVRVARPWSGATGAVSRVTVNAILSSSPTTLHGTSTVDLKT
jgi:hypothetical protein